MKRTSFSIIAVLLLGVAGCAGVAEPMGMEDPFAIPQPFRGVARNDAMLGQALEVPALVVEAPQGLHSVIAVALRDHIISVAQEHDVPALAEPTVLAWVLSGQAATVAAGDKAGSEQTVISWRLADDKGVEHAQFPVTFQGSEESLSEGGLRLLAEQTATALDAALLRPGTQVAEQLAESARPIAWIGTVKGAPGDGNKALASALQGVLPLKGVRVEAAKIKAEWRIEGQIKVVHGSATQDVVTLTWRILDAKGKEAGTIRQENVVPRGRLSKSWGEIAAFAAEAAAEGIAQLLQQVVSPKSA
jgi:hypothetical protein